MSQHVPADLLAAFVDGDVGEQLAIHIAGHLDACPACATQAAGLEPLAAAFAALDDPVPRADLAATVLAELDAPEPLPVVEVLLGFCLLGTAAIVAGTLGNPLGLAVEFGVVLDALGSLAGALTAGMGAVSNFALTLTTLVALAGCVATARMAAPLTTSSLGPSRRLT